MSEEGLKHKSHEATHGRLADRDQGQTALPSSEAVNILHGSRATLGGNWGQDKVWWTTTLVPTPLGPVLWPGRAILFFSFSHFI